MQHPPRDHRNRFAVYLTFKYSFFTDLSEHALQKLLEFWCHHAYSRQKWNIIIIIVIIIIITSDGSGAKLSNKLYDKKLT